MGLKREKFGVEEEMTEVDTVEFRERCEISGHICLGVSNPESVEDKRPREKSSEGGVGGKEEKVGELVGGGNACRWGVDGQGEKRYSSRAKAKKVFECFFAGALGAMTAPSDPLTSSRVSWSNSGAAVISGESVQGREE